MTALAVDTGRVRKGDGDLRSYLVAASVKIYKGAIVVIDSAGYARPARNNATDLVIAGIAEEQTDNTSGAAGALRVRVRSNCHFLLLCSATATQASVGLAFYALDDATVRAAQTLQAAGIVTEYVSATSVWVFIPTPVPTTSTPDAIIPNGNLRLGVVSAFATTEPTSAVVMKVGTNPVGAITTSGAIFVTTGGATISKIIADGTVSTIQT